MSKKIVAIYKRNQSGAFEVTKEVHVDAGEKVCLFDVGDGFLVVVGSLEPTDIEEIEPILALYRTGLDT